VKQVKTLRQVAAECGVSASYLSQVLHGVRPASEKVLSNPSFKVLSNVKHPAALPQDHLHAIIQTCVVPSSVVVAQRTLDHYPTLETVLNAFLASRRQGLSPLTIEFYRRTLHHSNLRPNATSDDVAAFLDGLRCNGGGKHAYYRALHAFFGWLYSKRSGYGLRPDDNPMLSVDAPLVERKILPSLTVEQVGYLIEQAECLRDRAIISLYADSGLRLSELANIDPANVVWDRRLIKVRCKGNKEGYAPYGDHTERLLREWLSTYHANGCLWDLKRWGIVAMLKRLEQKTGLPCHAHTFRRTFASILSKRGVDSLHIMRLGRWSSVQMVERYTKSVKFDDSLKFYSAVVS
jgi:site-specific recombinase XerD